MQLFLLFFFCFSIHLVPIHAFEFELDWAIPNATGAQAYNNWASKQRFQIGDTISESPLSYSLILSILHASIYLIVLTRSGLCDYIIYSL